MSYTSAHSGDNYRNWWPHPVMTAFTNDSIDLMERLARDTHNIFNMTSRGYALATRRSEIDELLANLRADTDVDIFKGRDLIRTMFPALSDDIRNVIHIKRGGDISGQQLGACMLERYREAGGKRLRGEVTEISNTGAFALHVKTAEGKKVIRADAVVNAAGPYARRVAAMVGVNLPVKNVYQQKIAFEDTLEAIPRDMPFSIDLDHKTLDWTDEERDLLANDSELAWLTKAMPGGTHCRPDGGANGKWVKLGWAYNDKASDPRRELANEPAIDPQFPEIVIRGAATFIPALRPYIESPPVRYSHYGGYYTMTEENWPVIGPAGPEGFFMVGALSGFGSMSACAAGSLCAAWLCGADLPDYAGPLSLARYDDTKLITELQSTSNKGLL